MKKRTLLIISLIFFILINTSYYWDEIIGIWAIPLIIALFICFLILGLAFIIQLFKSISEKFKSNGRTFLLVVLALVVGLTLYRPFGLINYDNVKGKDLLVAQREGSANCMTTLKLKEGGVFLNRNVCFMIKKIDGKYKLENDTIWFSDTKKGTDFYEFGVIKNTGNDSQEIVLFENRNDTIPLNLFVRKNGI